MKLSVLITTYNLVDYVNDTLKSVLNQKTEFEFEVLVGDDGSTDGTIDCIKEWVERYPQKIRYYVMNRKEGVVYNKIERASKNRLNLMDHATGDYLIFLDGDDFYIDELKLQKQVNILENNKDCIACAHNSYLYWSEERKKQINNYKKAFKISGKDYWRYGVYFFCDSFMFRNIFKGDKRNEINERYFDDNLIVFELLKYGEIYYLPDIMVCYRQHDDSIWNSLDAVGRNIVDLIEIDIEHQQNPNFRAESNIRHFRHYMFFLKKRNEISNSLRQKYKMQIKDDNLVEAERWLFFSEQPMIEQIKMTMWMGILWILFLWTKMEKMIKLQKYV